MIMNYSYIIIQSIIYMIKHGWVEMDKSKKEEAKLEAEETFWEGPPSSTEAV